MNTEILKQYSITARAGWLLKNFLRGCITDKSTSNALKIFDREEITLDMLSMFFPICTTSLYALAKLRKTNIITPDTVLENYGGNIHLLDAHLKVNNENFFIAKTGKSFQDKMKELRISLATKLNRFTYFMSDIALVCKVKEIRSRKSLVTLQTDYGVITMKNVVIPPNISIKSNDYAVVHLGYIACRVESDYKGILAKIKRIQSKNDELDRAFKQIAENNGGIINYRKFCPYKGKGCNLTEIQLDNYYLHK